MDVDHGDVRAACGQQLERVGRGGRDAHAQVELAVGVEVVAQRGVDAGVDGVRLEVEGERGLLAAVVPAARPAPPPPRALEGS